MFDDCDDLQNITIPATVTSVGHGAFSGCGLTSVTILNKVLGQSMFESNQGIGNVTIPSYVTSIGDNAFRGCPSALLIFLPPVVAHTVCIYYGLRDDQCVRG